jgi:hypothetical protein
MPVLYRHDTQIIDFFFRQLHLTFKIRNVPSLPEYQWYQ